MLSILNSQTTTAKAKASTQSVKNIFGKVGEILRPALRPILEKAIDAIVGDGQATAQQEEQMTPEKFFRVCCEIAMALSKGEDVSMMELCRRCCQVAEGLLDAGQGMSANQFYKFCCSVAKEIMGQATPTTPVAAVNGAKAQKLSRVLDIALPIILDRLG